MNQRTIQTASLECTHCGVALLVNGKLKVPCFDVMYGQRRTISSGELNDMVIEEMPQVCSDACALAIELSDDFSVKQGHNGKQRDRYWMTEKGIARVTLLTNELPGRLDYPSLPKESPPSP